MEGKSLIVIPFHVPWRWTSDYPTQTAQVLAKTNLVACFLWVDAKSLKEYLILKKLPCLIQKPSPFLYLFYPIHLIPFRRFHFVRLINFYLNLMLFRFWLITIYKKHKTSRRLLWQFSLFEPMFRFFPQILGKDYYLFYDCIDYLWSPNKSERFRLRKIEKQYITKTDLMTVNSRTLFKSYQTQTKNLHLVPYGFCPSKKNIKNKSLRTYPRPIIGFVGVLDYRIDWKLLYQLIKKNPKWNFMFIGPVSDEYKNSLIYQEFLQCKNVILLGVQEKDKIIRLINQFDVGIIPYNIKIELNQYCTPIKLLEYFYAGKPVVSTAIEELMNFSKYVKIAQNPKEWKNSIRAFIDKPLSRQLQKQAYKIALDNSWQNKVTMITKLIDKTNNLN